MLEVSEYFAGKVKSIALAQPEGRATIGVMAAGEYRFSTAEREIMQVISGELSVLLPGEDEWRRFTDGERFEVPAQSAFDVRVARDSAYLCEYR